MFRLPRASSMLAFGLSLSFVLSTASAVDIPGDFNGDGRLDALMQPATATQPGIIMLRDSTGNLTVLAQQWDAGYLGLDWSAADSILTAADLNGDGQDDVVLQPRKAGGTGAVLITDPSIQLLNIHQLLPAGYLGLDWSSAANVITAADFDGDRQKELLLQSTQLHGAAVMVHADATGQLVLIAQQFADGFLGRHWDAREETLYVGDFNGDGRQDLLVQSHLAGRGESVYALLLADPDGRFSHIAQAWNDNDLGANWNPVSHKIVIADTNGDGISEIELLSKSGGVNYLFQSDAQGQFAQPAAHWVGDKPAPSVSSAGSKSSSGSGISVQRTGLSANTISAPTNPEQDPTIPRNPVTGGYGVGAQGSGQIMTVNAAGTVAGSGGVSGGTATYSIPIAVPPGIVGMQPSISLNYSSRGGNGEMGMGWSLSAGSQIHRCPATLAMDGYAIGVNYSKYNGVTTDRLCLDGQHLILVSGTYGSNGAYYRTELDSFSSIQEFGDISSGTSYFYVYTKSGHQLRYGYATNIGSSANAVFTASGAPAPLAWGLGMELDQHNNSVIYKYGTFGAGEYLLTTILYTGQGASAGTREVDFSYSTRNDISSQYLAGGLTMQTQVLSAITTRVGTQLMHTYAMDYSTSAATGRTILAGVQQCGMNGSTQACLPESTFGWEGSSLGFSDPPLAYSLDIDGSQAADYDPNDRSVKPSLSSPGDFDGDGRRDLLYSRPGYHTQVVFVDGAGGSQYVDVDRSGMFTGGSMPVAVADINGDGAADLVGADGSKLAYSTFTGTASSPSFSALKDVTVDPSCGPSNFVAITDVNGDGKPDIVAYGADPNTSGNYALMFCKNTSSGGTVSFAAPVVMYSSAGSFIAKSAGDLDGNGLADFSIYIAQQFEGVVFADRNVTLGAGLRFDYVTATNMGLDRNVLDINSAPMQLDINGDGLPDYIFDCWGTTDICYQLNQGGTYGPIVDTGVTDQLILNSTIASANLVADIDNDGAQEVLYPAQLVADYCVLEKEQIEGVWETNDVCAHGSGTTKLPPQQDFSIYTYGELKFVAQADSTQPSGYSYHPVTKLTGIQAQAHLAVAGDIDGMGLTAVMSPFTKWYQGGEFNTATGYHNCPEPLPCGFQVAENNDTNGNGYDSAPDLMRSAYDGLGGIERWDYYPLSSPLNTNGMQLYQAQGIGASSRYAGDDYFYFNSSMYVVGKYLVTNAVHNYNEHDFHYGQAIYNNQGRGFQGFRTVVDDDKVSNARTVQVYHQRFPLSGTLAESWTTTQSSSVDLTAATPTADPGAIDHVVNTWGCMQGGQGQMVVQEATPISCDTSKLTAGTYAPVLEESVETHRDPITGDQLSQTTTQYCAASGLSCPNGSTPDDSGYDAYGNSLGSYSVTTDAFGTYSSSVLNTFDLSGAAGWWINKLHEKVTTVQAIYGSTTEPTRTRTTDYAYNGFRDMNYMQAKADGDPSHEVDTSYGFDSSELGNVTSVTVSGGSGATAVAARTTLTSYSTGSDAHYFVAKVTDPAGLITYYTADPRFGSPTSITAPDQVTTTKAYDAFGRVISSQVGSLPTQYIQYLTYTSGLCDSTPVATNYYVLVTQAGHPSQYTCHDMLDRAVRTGNESFSGAGDLVYRDTAYDTHGRVTGVSEAYFASQSPVWNTRHYDDSNILGRLASQTDAKGVTTSYTYNDLATQIVTTTPGSTPADSSITANSSYSRTDLEQRNSLGKLLTVTNALGATEQAATSYQYDSDGNPITITAADNTQIAASYDILGHKTDVTDPDQGHTGYTYDVLGELLSQTDAKSQTLTMAYDADGRMQTKGSPEGTTTWCYDGKAYASGACTGTTVAAAADKLSSVGQSWQSYQENYAYDTNGRVILDEEVIDGTAYDTNTSYDAYGRVNTVTYPSSVANATPVAVAGTTQQYVAPGVSVTLDASASSDPDNGPQPLAFQWAQTAGPAVTLSNPLAVNPSFTTGSALGTTYTFQVAADDGLSAGTASVNVVVPAAASTPATPTDDGDTNHDGYYTVNWPAQSVPGTTMYYYLEENTGTSSAPTGTWTPVSTCNGITSNSCPISHPGNSYYYYWYRVRAQDFVNGTPLGYSQYSGNDPIHVVVMPGQPSSISPSTGTTTTGTYTISWGPYTGGLASSKVFYELYESSSSTFATIHLVYSGANRSASISNSLGDYYYEVAACNGDGTLTICSPYTRKAHEIVNGTGGGGGGGCPPTGCTQPQIKIQLNPVTAPTATTAVGMVQPAEPDVRYADASITASQGGQETGLLAAPAQVPSGGTLHPAGEGQGMRVAALPKPGTWTHVRPRFAPPVYKAWADAHLANVTGTTPVARLAVQYLYTGVGYLRAVADATNTNRVFWNVNISAGSGPDTSGNYSEYGVDARGNPVDVYAGNGAVHSHYGYGQSSGYLASITSTSADGNTSYQNMSYQWSAVGNLQSRSSVVSGATLNETFDYDLHNRVVDSTVTNGSGTQPQATYSYYANGSLRCKSDIVGHACDNNSTDYGYGQGGSLPHAVTSITGVGSYAYDPDGNMQNRAGTNLDWNSDNLPTCIDAGGGHCATGTYSSFSYAPDKHRYKQIANTAGGMETTLYVGGLEIVTSGGTTHYLHTLMAYGRPVLLEDLSNSGTSVNMTQQAMLVDHLGSVETLVDVNTASTARRSYGTFGQGRDPGTWTSTSGGTASATTKHGYTDQEHLDALNLTHMNGRVYDETIGKFLSVDPVYQAPTNSQSVNPYSYVMNNPLSMVDPSGYAGDESACGTGDTQSTCAGKSGGDDKGGLKAGQSKTISYTPTGSHIAVTVTATVQSDGSVAISSNNGQVAQAIAGNVASMTGNGANSTEAANSAQNQPASSADVGSPATTSRQASAQAGGGDTVEVTGTDSSSTTGGIHTQKVDINIGISDRNASGGYDSADAAAIAQYKAYDPEYQQSVKDGSELTGLVVGTNGRFYFSNMASVPAQFDATEHLMGIRQEDIAGFTHTHPDGTGFNGLDYSTPAGSHLPFYERNSGGNVYKWAPAGAVRYQNYIRQMKQSGSAMAHETEIPNPAHWGITNICPGGGSCVP